MVRVDAVFERLKELGINFFTGVPDSLLKDFCAYITDHTTDDQHIIAANEGNAIALAAGHFLATGKSALVYMQNSGLGNAVNPLLSLADPDVYSIPMLLMIGWRGEPGIKDEPQHKKQGRVMLQMLEAMEIPYAILDKGVADAPGLITRVYHEMMERQAPYALVVREGTFEPYSLKRKSSSPYPCTREQAVQAIVDQLDERDIVVSTTGKTSRELFEYREAKNQGHANDFLTVGSMGHSSQIALAIALRHPGRKVYCFDGDGAAIMHMGGMAIVGQNGPANLVHIVFNNGAHDSVGGQPTVGFDIDLPGVALALGYSVALRAQTLEEINAALERMTEPRSGPGFLEIRVNKGARVDLGRPTTTPLQNRDSLMELLGSLPAHREGAK